MTARRSLSALGFGAAALIALACAPGAALADSRTDADQHFRRGVDLYRDKDYPAALVEFQRAYEIAPDVKVLYNIAGIQGLLQDYAGALKSFERYLSEGGSKLPASRRREVEKEIDKLKARVATITITANEPGAVVTVDDRPAGTTPLADPIVVSAGRRKITVTLAGRPPVTEVRDLAGGDVSTVAITIPTPETRVQVVRQEGPSIVGPAVAWAGTGVLTAGAVVTGLLALGASSDLKDKLGAYPADPKAITSAHDKALAFGIANDVLTGLAVATGGVAIWLTVRQQRAAADAKAPPPSARLVVYPNGVGVAGSF